ncbi:MAG: cadmium-translocating P-type ATPase [Desulfurococcales archaeon]|nr:cadmium-translocating P-type ATPase [Desulfurococcales archaeon]
MGEHEELTHYALLGALVLAGLASSLAIGEDYGFYFLLASTLFLVVHGLKEFMEDKRLNVDILMAVVGIVLVYHRVVLEGLIIYGLYSIAEVMEAWVSKLALRRLEDAQKLIPRRVAVERGRVEEVDIDSVKPGDVVVVRKGEVVPVNGILLTRGVFNTSMVTGESMPVELQPGSVVESGYINLGDPVRVKAVKSARESTLQLIVTRSLELLEEKGRTGQLINRLAPYMIAGVLLIFLPTYLALGPERSIPILLAGCPSAYIVTSAASTAYSVGKLARSSIIVRGGKALESASSCCSIVIDKTGTVTLGIPKPYKVVAPGLGEEETKSILASVASTSLHPVSRAIASQWKAGTSVREAREYPGKGVEALVNGSRVLLGSRNFIMEKTGSTPQSACQEDDITAYFAVDGIVGVVCLREEVSNESIETIKKLKRMGYKVVLASGDRRERVERVAKLLGVDEYYAEMSPEDKRKLVEDLRSRGCGVSMIGDGINDLEAMAASDFGVAVGNIDAVNNVADAVLIRGLGQAPKVFNLSRTYMRGLIAGMVAATIVKAAIIILGVAGAIPLWLAALLGDDGSTLLGTGVAAYMIWSTRV